AVLNSDPTARFTMANISEDELAAVIAHEFGHSLGLGHSEDSHALMHAEAVSVPSLAADDVDAITSLYANPPSADEQGGMFGCASVVAVGSGKGPRGGLGAVSGEWKQIKTRRDLAGIAELGLLFLFGYLGTLIGRRRERPFAELA
ncbi:MAG TPA: matrixin family metalloprotease, partial [Bdellovibrionota bacterium]|nr:matrixin family metalloprotease [Bdellovibrionota bacterium]